MWTTDVARAHRVARKVKATKLHSKTLPYCALCLPRSRSPLSFKKLALQAQHESQFDLPYRWAPRMPKYLITINCFINITTFNKAPTQP